MHFHQFILFLIIDQIIDTLLILLHKKIGVRNYIWIIGIDSRYLVPCWMKEMLICKLGQPIVKYFRLLVIILDSQEAVKIYISRLKRISSQNFLTGFPIHFIIRFQFRECLLIIPYAKLTRQLFGPCTNYSFFQIE